MSRLPSDARAEILARVRTALADRPAAPAVVRDYRQAGSGPADVDLFAERVSEYRASVRRCGAHEVPAAIAALLSGVTSVLVPDGFPDGWLPAALSPRRDTGQEASELDDVDGVLSTCALAVASTGTIVLDHGPGQGRRALTLVPDVHVVLVRAAQIVADVPDAVAAFDVHQPATGGALPAVLTFISGPSATSDIELNRVEGVHGPRVLRVLIVED